MGEKESISEPNDARNIRIGYQPALRNVNEKIKHPFTPGKNTALGDPEKKEEEVLNFELNVENR